MITPIKIKYWLTLQVEIATAFISKLLPMSIGSLTVNTFYLFRVTKSVAIAGSTMTLNAASSTVAFIIILGFALIGNLSFLNNISFKSHNFNWIFILIILIAAGDIAWRLIHSKKYINKLKEDSHELWINFKKYKNDPLKVFGGIFLNGIGTLTGVTTLYICTHSIGLNITFPEAILTYTLGNIIGSLVPTPGGIGGAEAGLYGGLVFFGFDPDSSLVAVLIYRFITYWLPLIPGYLMYRHLRKSTLSGFHIKNKQQKA